MVGGAGDERTLRWNREAFSRYRLRPRVLVDVSTVSTETTVLGTPVSMPALVAPMAFQQIAHEEGEVAMARGAGAPGRSCASRRSRRRRRPTSRRPLPGRPLAPDLRLSRPRRQRRVIAQALEVGFSALVLTADLPVYGIRHREARTGFEAPEDDVPAIVAARARGGEREGHHSLGLLESGLEWDYVTELCERGRSRPGEGARDSGGRGPRVPVRRRGCGRLEPRRSSARRCDRVARSAPGGRRRCRRPGRGLPRRRRTTRHRRRHGARARRPSGARRAARRSTVLRSAAPRASSRCSRSCARRPRTRLRCSAAARRPSHCGARQAGLAHGRRRAHAKRRPCSPCRRSRGEARARPAAARQARHRRYRHRTSRSETAYRFSAWQRSSARAPRRPDRRRLHDPHRRSVGPLDGAADPVGRRDRAERRALRRAGVTIIDPERTEVRFNGEWLATLDFAEILGSPA